MAGLRPVRRRLSAPRGRMCCRLLRRVELLANGLPLGPPLRRNSLPDVVRCSGHPGSPNSVSRIGSPSAPGIGRRLHPFDAGGDGLGLPRYLGLPRQPRPLGHPCRGGCPLHPESGSDSHVGETASSRGQRPLQPSGVQFDGTFSAVTRTALTTPCWPGCDVIFEADLRLDDCTPRHDVPRHVVGVRCVFLHRDNLDLLRRGRAWIEDVRVLCHEDADLAIAALRPVEFEPLGPDECELLLAGELPLALLPERPVAPARGLLLRPSLPEGHRVPRRGSSQPRRSIRRLRLHAGLRRVRGRPGGGCRTRGSS